MKALLITLLLFPIFAHATDCTKHPIYCHIVENKPSIDRLYAMELSNYIYAATSKYSVPADIYTAILMQESRYVNSATNCKTGIAKIPNPEIDIQREVCFRKHQTSSGRSWCVTELYVNLPETVYVEQSVCFDFGLSQINFRTAKAFGFDLPKILTDVEYAVDCGAKVLGDFHDRYVKKEPVVWYSRYNSSTPHHRRRYEHLIQKYLP